MEKIERIEVFYKSKFDWMPENIHTEIGHFIVFRLEPFVGNNANPIPYSRRDYFKISFVIGNGEMHYAEKLLR